MITKENGLKFAKLIHVSVDNGKTEQSNKIYIMEELSDGRIKCDYGRVGASLTTVYKSSYEWHKIYNEKTSPRKGYTDVTDLISEVTSTDSSSTKNDGIDSIPDSIVKRFIMDLMDFANKSIQRNYKVTQESVTEKQVESAQETLDDIIKSLAIDANIKDINDKLMKLYTIIPRKMDNVKNFILSDIKNNKDLENARRFLSNEQDTLDTMSGQVKLIKQQKDSIKNSLTTDNNTKKDLNILEQMGLIIEVEKDIENINLIHKLIGDNKNRIKEIYKVENIKTQSIFDKNIKDAKNKFKRLYWHGSRNENWFNIIQTGLLIRPSGAIHTGSMFGDGIYFADKSQKSLGYTSLSGSYWAKGNSSKGYLALFDVHLGNQKHIHNHDYSCYSLNESKLQAENCDSVFAHGGADLRNNEYIVYHPKRCTIKYIIEMS